jgi:hypothetical protein
VDNLLLESPELYEDLLIRGELKNGRE